MDLSMQNGRLSGFYISYQRMSSQEQMRGDSLRRQGTLLKNFLEKHDLVEAETVVEIGSGFHRKEINKDENPNDFSGFNKIIYAFDKGKFDTINNDYYLIVEALDRFSRQKMTISLSLFLAILNKNIKIITLFDEKVYKKGDDQLSIIQAVVYLEMAHKESLNKSVRINKVYQEKRENAKNNIIFTSKAPAWLRSEGNIKDKKAKWIILEDRVNIIKIIFEKSINENMGKAQIASYLNSKLKIKSFTGKIWSQSYIAKLLKDRRLIGYFQPKSYINGTNQRKTVGEEIPKYYPTVIDYSLFKKSVNKIEERAKINGGDRLKQGGRTGNNSNLFTGLVKCVKCGSNVHLKNSSHGNQSYFVCSQKPICDAPNLRYEYFESIFISIINEINVISLLSNNDLKTQKEKARSIVSGLEFELADQNEKLKNLANAIAEGLAFDQVLKKYNDTKKIIDKLKNEIEDNKLILFQDDNDYTLKDIQVIYKKIKEDKDDIKLRVQLSYLIKEVIERIAVDGELKQCGILFKDKAVKDAISKCFADINGVMTLIELDKAVTTDQSFTIPVDKIFMQKVCSNSISENEKLLIKQSLTTPIQYRKRFEKAFGRLIKKQDSMFNQFTKEIKNEFLNGRLILQKDNPYINNAK